MSHVRTFILGSGNASKPHIIQGSGPEIEHSSNCDWEFQMGPECHKNSQLWTLLKIRFASIDESLRQYCLCSDVCNKKF